MNSAAIPLSFGLSEAILSGYLKILFIIFAEVASACGASKMTASDGPCFFSKFQRARESLRGRKGSCESLTDFATCEF